MGITSVLLPSLNHCLSISLIILQQRLWNKRPQDHYLEIFFAISGLVSISHHCLCLQRPLPCRAIITNLTIRIVCQQRVRVSACLLGVPVTDLSVCSVTPDTESGGGIWDEDEQELCSACNRIIHHLAHLIRAVEPAAVIRYCTSKVLSAQIYPIWKWSCSFNRLRKMICLRGLSESNK